MTEDYLREVLAEAVRNAVASALAAPQRQMEVTARATGMAEAMVLPAARAMAAEAAEGAVIAACAPWYQLALLDEAITLTIPDTKQPLFWVWMTGAMMACACVAQNLGVAMDLEPGAADGIDDGGDLVEAVVASMLSQALMRQALS